MIRTATRAAGGTGMMGIVYRRIILAVAAAMLIPACAPRIAPMGKPVTAPRLEAARFVAADGVALPLRVWRPTGETRAVIVAVHGFNDYSNAFQGAAAFWAERGIVTYAYDQRGFGGAPATGLWPGIETLTTDLEAIAALVRERHAGLPLFILGNSMGGAVVMVALAGGGLAGPMDGVVLVAPAVWGRRFMNPLQRGALWLFAHTIPWFTLTGQGLRITPSDNIEMLRRLGKDPKIIKRTRIDTLWGLVDLMDAALAAAPRIEAPALVLYGLRDEVIPAGPTLEALGLLSRDTTKRGIYRGGYHMLLRDLKAKEAWADIAAWIADRRKPLPSGADEAAEALLKGAAASP